MRRKLRELTGNVHDLLVVGGGIYGACVARDGILRGLSVALIEKSDFTAATSANSLKVIHGGFRYLQHGDLKRMRESIRERATLMRIAPHLVHPLPVLIPSYGHWSHGKEILALALRVNDLIGFDRNRSADPDKYIPHGRVISRSDFLTIMPALDSRDLTGGAMFYDAQVYNSERLVISILRAAAQSGAVLANYVEATGFLRRGDSIVGVEARDVLTDDRFAIQARIVVNTSGPWVDRVLDLLRGRPPGTGARFVKAMNVLTEQVCHPYAVGIPRQNGHRNTHLVMNRGSRFLFIIPWRARSLIGTSYVPWEGNPDNVGINEEEIQTFLGEINQAYPAAAIKIEDVSFVHVGLIPVSRTRKDLAQVQLATHCGIHDHRHQGIKGLLSVVGVKYTTARHVAEKVVDLVFGIWGRRAPQSPAAVTPIYGGQIEHFAGFLRSAFTQLRDQLPEAVIRPLIYNYGSAYPEVIQYLGHDREKGEGLADRATVLKAETLHGIRDEMAQSLSDIVFRRTELATTGHPGWPYLRTCAEVMGAELGWSGDRAEQELQRVNEVFPLKNRCRAGRG